MTEQDKEVAIQTVKDILHVHDRPEVTMESI